MLEGLIKIRGAAKAQPSPGSNGGGGNQVAHAGWVLFKRCSNPVTKLIHTREGNVLMTASVNTVNGTAHPMTWEFVHQLAVQMRMSSERL